MEANKTIVKRFNKESIEQGNLTSFKELLSDKIINHSAPKAQQMGLKVFTILSMKS